MSENLPLQGWCVAVPESRQLDIFVQMLEQRGASTVRCPLVSIYDSPNEDSIVAWLKAFIAAPPADLIILTGEGLRRLTGFAERSGLKDSWVNALTKTRKIVRGPKPGRALSEIGLKPDVLAEAPTTDGVIATLDKELIAGRSIAVQLYGEDPNEKLQNYLTDKQATFSVVAPYIYAPHSETEHVQALVEAIIRHEVDVVVFTSMQQLPRLFSVAKKVEREDELLDALRHSVIAAIGPIVEEKLNSLGLRSTIMPEEKYFMKPLVRKLMAYVAEHPKSV